MLKFTSDHSLILSGPILQNIFRDIFKKKNIVLITVSRFKKNTQETSLLCSDSHFGKIILENDYHTGPKNFIQNSNRFFDLWCVSGFLQKIGSSDRIIEERKRLGYLNGISITQDSKDFIDRFSFCSSDHLSNPNDFLLNNIDYLLNLILLIRDKIHHCEDLKKIFNKKYKIKSLKMIKDDEKESSDVKPKNIFLGGFFGDSSISKREFECLKKYYCNYSCYEIGADLGISSRTVDKHLENARIKLGFKNLPTLKRELSNNPFFTQL